MVWDRWGWRKEYRKELRDYKRGKESEALFGRTPSRELLFLANNDSDGIEYQYIGPNLTYQSARKLNEALSREQRGIGKCRSNTNCPTGYACIDGTCVKIYTRDSTQWGTCGESNIEFPCKNKKSSDNKCNDSRPGPGDCLESECGPGSPKCCRQNANGSVECYCGECKNVEPNTCSVYCDDYYKTFGIIAAGCNKPDNQKAYCGGNICSECETCTPDFFGGPAQCKPFELGDIGAPCHCVGCEKPCEYCNKDYESPTFGNCYFDGNNCQVCCSQSNPQCTCGPLTELGGSVSTCAPYYGKACPSVLRDKINALCEQKCATEPDPCAPECTTKTYEIDAVDLPTFEPDPCPAKSTCTNAGSMTVGSTSIVFEKICNFENVPESCKETDCNCNNDCPSCEICNAQGKCEDDPNCQGLTYTVRARSGGGRSAAAQSFGGIGCTGCNQDTVNITTRTFTGQSITDVWEWRATSTYQSTWSGGNPCDPCEDNFLAPNQQLTATVYYLFKNDELYTDGTYPSGITYTDQFLFTQGFQDGSGYGKQEGNTGTISYTVEP
jgi:hypothetical protein